VQINPGAVKLAEERDEILKRATEAADAPRRLDIELAPRGIEPELKRPLRLFAPGCWPRLAV